MQIITTILTGLHCSRSHFQARFTSFMLLTFQMFTIGLWTGTAYFTNFTVMELLWFRLGFWALWFHVPTFFETWPTLIRTKQTKYEKKKVLISISKHLCLKETLTLTHYLACSTAVRHTLWLHCTTRHHSLNNY